jgi:hypothetical protein
MTDTTRDHLIQQQSLVARHRAAKIFSLENFSVKMKNLLP